MWNFPGLFFYPFSVFFMLQLAIFLPAASSMAKKPLIQLHFVLR